MEGVVEEIAGVVMVEVQEVEGRGEMGGLAEEGQVGLTEAGLLVVGMVVGVKEAQGVRGEEVQKVVVAIDRVEGAQEVVEEGLVEEEGAVSEVG
ncbi:TPA: hypothetical protein ACH3X2_004597 [Trebouxia sp. C0005]